MGYNKSEKMREALTDMTDGQKEILLATPLFCGIATADAEVLLACLAPTLRHVPRDGMVLAAGDAPRFVGVLLAGEVHIVHDDYWGNRSILSAVLPGDVFGEAFALGAAPALPVSVLAKRESLVLLLDSSRLLVACPPPCAGHAALLRNLIRVLAKKNIALTDKIRHMTKKTTRARVMSYLSEVAAETGKNTFEIPFNRQEMADYLAVERSALSATLSGMQAEGLITFRKNRFTLHVEIGEKA